MADDPKEKGDNSEEAFKQLVEAVFSKSTPTAPTSFSPLLELTLSEALNAPYLDDYHLKRSRELRDQISELRRQFEDQAQELSKEKTSGKQKQQRIEALEKTLNDLHAKENLSFLLDRVNQEAQRVLLRSETFRKRFLETKECIATVMSVDIRRSTELMLKARNPDKFASFITTLGGRLMRIITDSYGVFDKFTGDGVLAFFPEFYSGIDAAYNAISAADKCHAAFKQLYQEFRKSFISVLTDIGLGIGIDHGIVHLVQMGGGLTVVGGPVVYACRLSGAPPNVTLVNQPAYEIISDRFGGYCFATETEIEIKHEGSMLAYDVRLNRRDYKPAVPDWLAEANQQQS
ncbi:MAG: hypothetical protein HYY45_19770 [Deltaproteobacteria bacterium]|nr:hypothetical protein [Deltaproteobacteria bacterium]